MAKITNSVYMNTQNFDEGYERIIKKKETLEKKTKLTVDESGLLKTIELFDKIKEKKEEQQRLENKRINGSATKAELQQLTVINKSLGQNTRHLNEYLEKLQQTSPMYANMIKNLNSILDVNKRINQESLKETKNNKQKIQAEHDLINLRKKTQESLRQLGDALNPNKKGAKTGLDIAYLQKEVQEAMKQFEKLRKILGEGNKEVKHFLDGIDFTKLNNGLRASRDEAQKMANEIPRIARELKKLQQNPNKNEHQIGFDTQKLEQYRTAIAEIISEQKKFYNSKAAQYGLGKKEIEDAQKMLDKIMAQCDAQTRELVLKQQEINLDRAEQEQEKNYLSTLQQKYQLENKIAQLSGTKTSRKTHKNEIKEYQQQLSLLNQKLQLLKNEGLQTEKIEGNIKELTIAHLKEQQAIAAKNVDLNKTTKLWSQTMANFAKFTLYYTMLNAAKTAVHDAVETMKELDKAFTDIQMVTGGTKEETAELAQEYNNLAKEMGSTTKEVAEGAGEWFNESRDH